jgi:hypothetical protein
VTRLAMLIATHNMERVRMDGRVSLVDHQIVELD